VSLALIYIKRGWDPLVLKIWPAILLIYFEQTAILYIFSTLGVTVLLVIVATADLGQSEVSADDAAPISSAANPARLSK